jgi:rhomboid protease GluP
LTVEDAVATLGDDDDIRDDGGEWSDETSNDGLDGDDGLGDGANPPDSGFVVDEEGRVEVLDLGDVAGASHPGAADGGSGDERFVLRPPSLWTGSMRLLSLLAIGGYLGYVLPEAFAGPVGLFDLLLLAGIPLAIVAYTLYALWRLPDGPQAIVFRDDEVVLPKGPDTSTEWTVPYPDVRSVVIMTRGGNEMVMIETESRRVTYGHDAFERSYGPETCKREMMRRIRQHPRGPSILERMQTLEEHARAATSNPTRVTYGLLGLLLVYYAVEHLTGALSQTFGLIQLGANSAALIDSGQYFRLISGNFLHGGFLHIFMNGIALFFLGLALERTLGSWRFLLIYLVSALGGAFASYWWTAAPMSVGSSTAIFGLVGAFGVLHLKYWRELPPPYRQTVRWWVFILTINLGISLVPMVDGAAHFGGLAVGAATTYLVLWPMEEFDPTRPPEWALQIATIALVLLFAAGLGRAAVYAMGDHPEDREALLEQTIQQTIDDRQHQRINQLAWMTAIRGDVSRRELDIARRGITRALEWAEGREPQYRDTLATIHYRLGLASSGDARKQHLGEAVSIEYDVLETGESIGPEDDWLVEIFESERDVFRSQLARFLHVYVDAYGLYHVGTPWRGEPSLTLQFGESSTLNARWPTPPERDTEVGALVFDGKELIGMLELCIPGGREGGTISIDRTPPRQKPEGGSACMPADGGPSETLEPHVRPALTDTDADCQGRLRGQFWPMSPEVEAYP